ncbi:hypothetical protein GMOD_00005187 [Pyrenophora seminiperda CCB06]|uniref:Uncharacterized protein n=1 Tax=Pyrenophora seminiperda CCB06 TaxID=1302712 RepID=A0A3M7LV66_9PLEO|nr:hypothetical protein GMOD_00005187 [Pyrenophora seminiperda CCB06]
MTQYQHSSRRPHQRNNNANFNSRSGHRVTKWQDRREKDDDDDDHIAPSGVSGSTHQLQQWALLTAGMAQQPTKRHKSRAIEDKMRERIQKRYEGQKQHRATPLGASNLLTEHHVPSNNLMSQTTNKHPRSPSSADPTPHAGLSTACYVRSIKRARSRSPSPTTTTVDSASTHRARQMEGLSTRADADESDYYYQSSEWSFPSSDEEFIEIR